MGSEGACSGFRICGHSMTAPCGKDIVCAAVSSAVMMTVNTLTEIMGEGVKVTAGENEIEVTGCTDPCGRKVIEGLKLHLSLLSGDHPQAIRVKTEE